MTLNITETVLREFVRLLKIGNNKKYKFVIDVQDEPLISPNHIDKVVEFHEKNLDADIVLPSLKVKPTNNTNLVKLVSNSKNEVCTSQEQIFLTNLKINQRI